MVQRAGGMSGENRGCLPAVKPDNTADKINVSLPCNWEFIGGEFDPRSKKTPQGRVGSAEGVTLTGGRSLGQNENGKLEWILWESTERCPEPKQGVGAGNKKSQLR